MKHEKGMSLLELMIVVAIVGILAAIAVPSYLEHIVRGKIAQGTEALSEAKVRMEQYFNTKRTYESAMGNSTCPDLFSGLFADTPFTVSMSSCSQTTFTITATGSSAKGMDGFTYTINQAGEKTSQTPSVDGAQSCWLMSKAATSC